MSGERLGNTHKVSILKNPEDLTTEILNQITSCTDQVFFIQKKNGENLYTQAYFTKIIENGGRIFFVQERGQIIGLLSVRLDKYGRHVAENVLVLKEFRKSGVYAQMLMSAFEYALTSQIKDFYFSTANPFIEWSLERELKTLKEGGLIKDYTIKREKKSFISGQQITSESQPQSPDENLNEVYRTLDYPKGEAFLILISLAYPPTSRSID